MKEKSKWDFCPIWVCIKLHRPWPLPHAILHSFISGGYGGWMFESAAHDAAKVIQRRGFRDKYGDRVYVVLKP